MNTIHSLFQAAVRIKIETVRAVREREIKLQLLNKRQLHVNQAQLCARAVYRVLV